MPHRSPARTWPAKVVAHEDGEWLVQRRDGQRKVGDRIHLQHPRAGRAEDLADERLERRAQADEYQVLDGSGGRHGGSEGVGSFRFIDLVVNVKGSSAGAEAGGGSRVARWQGLTGGGREIY